MTRRIVGILGGTGKQGNALALRWAKVHDVILGSRDPARAITHARACSHEAGASIRGASHAATAREANVVVLSVPYGAHAATLREVAAELEGKLVLDMTVPLAPPDITRVHLPPGRAAALEARALLGPRTRVVAALHHVSSQHIGDLARPLDGDVLVCGDDPAAKGIIFEMIADLGLRALDAGPLENAIALETLTPVLLHINRHHGFRGAGIRILGNHSKGNS